MDPFLRMVTPTLPADLKVPVQLADVSSRHMDMCNENSKPQRDTTILNVHNEKVV